MQTPKPSQPIEQAIESLKKRPAVLDLVPGKKPRRAGGKQSRREREQKRKNRGRGKRKRGRGW